MGFDFSLVDVFSDRPFGGNQLAVFRDAAGIADETMQRLAREFNFSETTFVLPASDPSCTCRVRIFTPRQELPFARSQRFPGRCPGAFRSATGQ